MEKMNTGRKQRKSKKLRIFGAGCGVGLGVGANVGVSQRFTCGQHSTTERQSLFTKQKKLLSTY